MNFNSVGFIYIFNVDTVVPYESKSSYELILSDSESHAIPTNHQCLITNDY